MSEEVNQNQVQVPPVYQQEPPVYQQAPPGYQQAPPLAQPSGQQVPVAGQKVQKSGCSGCLKGCLITLIIFTAVCIISAIGIFALVKASQPKEVDYSKKDVKSFYEKAGIENDDDTPSLEDLLKGNFIATGSTFVDETFTSEEITAILQDAAGKKDIFENVNLRFIDDGEIEVFANIGDRIDELYEESPELESFSWALDRLKNATIYYRGDVQYDKEDGFSFDVTKLKVGPLKLPNDSIEEYKDTVETLINQTFSKIEGLDIESIDFTEDGMEFVGNIPTELSKK